MGGNGCRISQFRIVRIACNIDETLEHGVLTIETENRVSAKRPTEPEEKKCMLQIETKLRPTKGEGVSMDISSESIFEFDTMPENFESALKDDCYPIAWERIKKAIKEITAAMGIAPIDLTEVDKPE